MNRIISTIFLCLLVGICLSSAQTSVYVRPYLKHDGTLVQGHFRSIPDGNVFNNWSVYPNINPYTGELGTKDPWTEYFRQQQRSSGLYGYNYYVPRVSSDYQSEDYLDSYKNDYSNDHVDYNSHIYLPDFNFSPLPSLLELEDDQTPFYESDYGDMDSSDDD